MSTPWGTSPYASSTPVIDSVMHNPATAPTPVPIPGLMPLPFPQFMAPSAPLPYMGMPQLGFPPAQVPYMGLPQFGFMPTPLPYMGMPMGVPQLGFPPAQVPYMGLPQLGFPPAQVPYMGLPSPLMAPQATAPYMGVPQLGVHPAAAALGLDMQSTSWPIAGLGGHAVSPVTAALLSQIGLREAVAKIGDEALKQRVTTSINEAIDRTIEGVSAMTLHPWFGPGAQFTIYPIAAQLALIAERYPDGAVRDALRNIAGQILQKSLAPTGESGRHK